MNIKEEWRTYINDGKAQRDNLSFDKWLKAKPKPLYSSKLKRIQN